MAFIGDNGKWKRRGYNSWGSWGGITDSVAALWKASNLSVCFVSLQV